MSNSIILDGSLITPWSEKAFLEYIKFWHGDHQYTEVFPCDIFDEIQLFNKGESSIAKLFEVFMDVDGDLESLQQYIVDRIEGSRSYVS